MIIVGLTGGIGSGKSTVAEFFSKLDVSIYVADVEAKKIMNTSKSIRKRLINEFGSEAYTEDQQLNRAYLAAIVFNDKDKLDIINSIIHPKIDKHFSKWVQKQNSPYVIQENAIIFENNNAEKFDYIIAVTAPIEVRIKRVIKRDLTTKKNVIARMKNQWDEAKKNKLADYVIHNTNLADTKKQVEFIHKKLLKLIKEKKLLNNC